MTQVEKYLRYKIDDKDHLCCGTEKNTGPNYANQSESGDWQAKAATKSKKQRKKRVENCREKGKRETTHKAQEMSDGYESRDEEYLRVSFS